MRNGVLGQMWFDTKVLLQSLMAFTSILNDNVVIIATLGNGPNYGSLMLKNDRNRFLICSRPSVANCDNPSVISFSLV